MYKNEQKVRELEEEISKRLEGLNNIKNQLAIEKRAVPEGFIELKEGDLVKDGAIGFEPHHGNWGYVGNSVGCVINKFGFVSEYVHRGWVFANPIIEIPVKNKCPKCHFELHPSGQCVNQFCSY